MISNLGKNSLILKLTSGEEIITSEYEISDDSNFITINNPYFILKLLKTERVTFQLDKWMPYTINAKFSIALRDIIMYNEASNDMHEFFMQTINQDQEAEHYHDFTGQIH